MTPHTATFRARPLLKQTAATRATPREDARWVRPTFRPPPLDIQPVPDVLSYLETTHRTEPWAGSSRHSVFAK
jgi:hypothetical protein